MRIGIFGGSFDPVHRGHLKLAQAALEELNLDKVIFVPAYQNPLKHVGNRHAYSLPQATRIRLLREALKKSSPRFSVSLCEIRRQGPSYTVDTLRYFKKRYPKAMLYFLSGADVLKNLKRWRAFGEVTRLSRFVVMTRPGHRLSKAPRGVLTLPFDALPISSTRIRRKPGVGNRHAYSLVPKEARHRIA